MKNTYDSNINGLLLIDKSVDWTSHDVVNKIRNHFRIKKVGHAGTLDPMATGLLVILLGAATKCSQQIMNGGKKYEGIMRLGIETDSQDRDGNILRESDFSEITAPMVQHIMKQWEGEQQQIPPMFSAVKKNGVPLYKLARKGKSIERKPRTIIIHQLELTGFSLPDVFITVSCSKGTYVRTLCADIGTKLGCGAHLRDLSRTVSEPFKLENAFGLDEVLKWDLQTLSTHVISPKVLL